MRSRILVCALATAGLVGCAAMERVDESAKRVEKAAETAGAVAKTVRDSRQKPPRDTVVFSEEVWVDPRPIDLRKNEVPEALRCEIAINAEKAPIDILEFGQVVTRWCRVPARVTPDALQAMVTNARLVMGQVGTIGTTMGAMGTIPGMGSFTGTGSFTGMGLAPGMGSVPGLPAIPGQSVPGVMPGQQNPMSMYSGLGGRAGMIDIKYQGPLKPLLDMVSQRLGISWKMVDNAISFYYLDTRVFNFASMALATEFSSAVQSGMTVTSGSSGSAGGSSTGGGSQGSSGSQQSATVSMRTSKWEDVAKSIASMLTPNVGRMSTSPSSGSITVTDTAEALARVERFVSGENEALTKQVLFNIKILSVALRDSDGLGIDWTLVYKSLSGNFGLSLKNVTASSADSVKATASVLSGATGDAAKFAGTSAVISALSQQGRVSTLRSPSVVTLNMHSVPLQIGNQVSYVASSQTTATANVGSTTSLTPGSVTTGFNMILLPYVLPSNEMLLQSSINISSLTRIRPVTSGTTTIEVPEVNSQIFSQTARLRAGETLVLSGFEELSDSTSKSGVGSPNNIIFGGQRNRQGSRDVIVVLITPIIQD